MSDELEEKFEHRRRHEGAGFGIDTERNKKVEEAAVKMVADWYRRHGWSVKSVEQDHCGYDLICTKGNKHRHVEVKGASGSSPSFIITQPELKQAKDNPLFRLCVVTNSLSQSRKLNELTGRRLLSAYQFDPLAFMAKRTAVVGKR
jgi:hypothetical protein